MLTYTRKSQRKSFELDEQQFKLLLAIPGSGTATLYENLGPNYADLFVFRPQSRAHPRVVYLVVRNAKLTRADVLQKIGYGA